MIIDGTKIAEDLKSEVKDKLQQMAGENKFVRLDVIIAGDDPASKVYVRNKKKVCGQVGIKSEVHELPEAITEAEFLKKIDELNANPEVTGILVQSPLPKHVSEEKVNMRIDPLKDVDCFNPYNIGLLNVSKDAKLLPGTPAGIIELLKRSNIEISGKTCAVVGRSNIVGKPAAMLMLAENATVTICHSKTKNLAETLRGMDIIIAAIGKPKFITADMVKDGAVVIDVGINELPGGLTKSGKRRLCGDVDFESVSKKASYITPVPGGVGPMTIAMLMNNCLKAWELQNAE